MSITCGTSTWLDAVNLINENETNIVGLDTRVSANELAIATNEDGITALDTRVTTLEGFHEADWAQVFNINDIPDTWTQVLTLNMAGVKAGVYQLSISILYTYSSTSSSAELRLTLNGAVYNFTREPKDSSDTEVGQIILPVNMTGGGDINVLIEAQKESGGPTFNILEGNAICIKFL